MEKELGDYLRTLRKNKKLTLVEMAVRLGLSQPYLSQIENGKREAPKPELLKKIADLLNEDFLELMVKAGHLSEDQANRQKALESHRDKNIEEMRMVQVEYKINQYIENQEKDHLSMIYHFCKDFIQMYDSGNLQAINAAKRIVEYTEKIEDLNNTRETVRDAIQEGMTGFILIEND